LQLYGEPLAKKLGFLHIHVNMMSPVLGEVVELVGVVIHGVVPLLQVEELLQFAAHEARR
jgi:hypothetical protein